MTSTERTGGVEEEVAQKDIGNDDLCVQDDSISQTHTNSRRSTQRTSSIYKPNIKSIFRCCDYTRPLASKEDTVVYYKKGDIGLAHVHRVDRRKLDANLYESLISCQTLELETIPSCRRIRRLVEEVFVVDRGFSVGETVIKYENEFAGNPEKEHMCMPQLETAIGQVVNVEVRGDVLVLPQKSLVVKNVPLGRNEYTEMVNYNSAHNYIMYKDWIGNASDCINEVTLIYRGRHRFVVREGGRSGVYLRRQDHSDDGKALVPGECVSISISEAIGRSATWESGPPKALTASRRRRGVDSIKCVIEKIEAHSIIVDWITSPSSTRSPPKTIPKHDLSKVTRIDPSANPRPSTCDRVKVVPDGLSTVCTIKEFFSDLTEHCHGRFKKLKARGDEALTTPCENCSKALQTEPKQSSTTAKAPKIARLSNSSEQVRESECASSQNTAASTFTLNNSDTLLLAQGDEVNADDAMESHDSSDENDIPSSCGKTRVSVCRSLLRQKRTRKYPNRRRRRTPSLPVGCSRLAKDVLGDGFIGEFMYVPVLHRVCEDGRCLDRHLDLFLLLNDNQVLLSNTLVDVQWMNGTIERQIPGYLLIPHDPDLDQQDHLPGVIVTRKDAQNAESVFGLILSTNCAERSCVVSWFKRGEHSVNVLDKEECLLFDIMPHPHYKRLFIGNYGVVLDQRHSSNDIRDVAFQVVADLSNGKQRVRFLNGREEELWPFDILPIHFVDESLDSDSDESSILTEVDASKDVEEESLTLADVLHVLQRYSISPCADPSCEVDSGSGGVIQAAITAFLVRFPELDKLTSERFPHDAKARSFQNFFAGSILEASESKWKPPSESLVLFADMMTVLNRSRLLPDNFSVNHLSSLIDDYENQKVFDKYLLSCDSASLAEVKQFAEEHPEWLLIFHNVSGYFSDHKEDAVRIPLRSKLHEFVDSASCFKPRHLSWEYIQSIADDLLAVHSVFDERGEPNSSKNEKKRAASGGRLMEDIPSVSLCLKATTREMARGFNETKLVISLVTQIMELAHSSLKDVSSVVLYPTVQVSMEDVTAECEPDEALENARVHTFASALVLLHRCGLLNYNCLMADSVWKDLNHVFSEKFVSPSFVEYPTLHEIIAYVRSMDFHYPALLKRLSVFTQAYSFDRLSSQIAKEFSRKLDEIGCVNSTIRKESERQLATTLEERKGTFTMLDECPDPHEDRSEFAATRMFYSTVFKEHRMLAEHVPESIHIHAFADRLNIIHVLIIGPSGTPFDSTPFYFIFNLHSDYPAKPPEVTYVAYSQEQLNPNLYQNGKVCTSLLGTWSGQGVETWNPSKSNLLQVLLSIQALILVPEPYYNEAGYEARKQQAEMADRSKRYNETATINSLEYLLKIYKDPPADFKDLVKEIVEKEWQGLRSRVQGWINGSSPPSFPVMNSKGFKIALEKAIVRMDAIIRPCSSIQMNSEEPMEVGDCNLEMEEDEKPENAYEEKVYEWTVVGERRKTA